MPPKKDYEILFKLVLVGNTAVGKSCLLLKFADDSFSDSYIATIGVDFRFRTIKVDDKIVKLQIWDTAGQERFRTITSTYYRGVNGVVLVYDTTSRESFESLDGWIQEARKYSKPDMRILIIGNKCDLTSKKVVSVEEVREKYSGEYFQVIEASAKEGTNVEEAFMSISRVLRKQQEGEQEQKEAPVVNLSNENTSSWCCS